MPLSSDALAPPPVSVFKSLLNLAPGVADTQIIAGHDMSDEDLCKAIGRADVVLGDFTFKRRIGRDPLAKTGPLKIKLIQQPSVGYEHIDIKACSERGIRVANTPGRSSAIEKQREKRRLLEAKSFGQFRETWLTAAPMADSTRAMRRAIFERVLLPAWRNRLLTEITPDDLRAHCGRSSNEAHRRPRSMFVTSSNRFTASQF